MGERAMNYLALRSSAITRITTEVLSRLVDLSVFFRSHAEGRVFVFETNFAPMYARKWPGSTFDLEVELALQRYLGNLGQGEFRMVRVIEQGERVDYRGEWTDHPFQNIEAVRSIQSAFDAVMNRTEATAAHPACKADVRVNSGALTLALNVLRRAGKHEVADELEASAQREPSTDKELTAKITSMLQQARKQIVEPFSIQVSEKVDVEIRPLTEDERIIVGHKDWGYTVVNYTAEGVIVDSFAEGDLDAARSYSIGSDQLCAQQADTATR